LVYRIVSLWLVLAAGGLTLMALGGPKVLTDDNDDTDEPHDTDEPDRTAKTDNSDDRADPARSG